VLGTVTRFCCPFRAGGIKRVSQGKPSAMVSWPVGPQRRYQTYILVLLAKRHPFPCILLIPLTIHVPQGHESIGFTLGICFMGRALRGPECRSIAGTIFCRPFRAVPNKTLTQAKAWAMFSSPFGARISMGSSKIKNPTHVTTTRLAPCSPRRLTPHARILLTIRAAIHAPHAAKAFRDHFYSA
jgi:hypothetical protein